MTNVELSTATGNGKHARYRISNFSQVILYKLYEKHIDSDDDIKLTPREIKEIFNNTVSTNLVRSSIELLRTRGHRGLVNRHGTAEKGYAFSINERGIIAVENDLRRTNTLICYYHLHGDDALEEVAGLGTVFLTQEEREEAEDWAPLPIDRTEEAYQETIESIEKGIEAIEQDNGFAVAHPSERQGILDTLRNGLQWLKERSPSKEIIFSTIVRPFQRVSAIFGSSIVGEIAKETAKHVAEYVASFF
jgi:hypothetical protein